LNCCWQAAGGGSWGVAGHGGACRCSRLVRGCVGGLGGGQQGRQWRRQLRWQWHWRQRRQQCVAAATAAATAATAGGGARAGMAGGRGWGQHAALGETKGHGPRPELITLGLACNTPRRRPWNLPRNRLPGGFCLPYMAFLWAYMGWYGLIWAIFFWSCF